MNARLIRVTVVLAILTTVTTFPEISEAKSPHVAYSISPGVSASDAMYVREGIALAVDYLENVYDAKLSANISVNVRDVASPIDPGVLAFASGDFLVIFTGAPGWDYMSPALRLQVIIHEFVHIFQYDTIGNDEDSSPMWFIEGMAEYVSFEVVESLHILSLDDIYDAQTFAVARGGDEAPGLDELEEVADFQSAYGPVYPLSYLAVSKLAADHPVARLTKYLDLVADGKAWRSAFRRAFGSSPDAFYDEFQNWLTDEMLAPAHQPISFTAVDTDGIDADVEVITAPASAEIGDQILVVAQTDPNAGCRFELTDSAGNRSDRIESIADQSGGVYLLETIPSGFATGRGSVSVDCGGERDRIELPIVA